MKPKDQCSEGIVFARKFVVIKPCNNWWIPARDLFSRPVYKSIFKRRSLLPPYIPLSFLAWQFGMQENRLFIYITRANLHPHNRPSPVYVSKVQCAKTSMSSLYTLQYTSTRRKNGLFALANQVWNNGTTSPSHRTTNICIFSSMWCSKSNLSVLITCIIYSRLSVTICLNDKMIICMVGSSYSRKTYSAELCIVLINKIYNLE